MCLLGIDFRDYREHRSELLMARTLEDFDLFKKNWSDDLRHKIFWFARKTAMHASKVWGYGPWWVYLFSCISTNQNKTNVFLENNKNKANVGLEFFCVG